MPVEFTEIESSTIARCGRDADTGLVVIEFKPSKKGGLGTRYEYEGIPEDVYQQLVTAESVGRFFAANIKGIYETRKLGTLGTHIDGPCWKTGEFIQVPCPHHDGLHRYPKGAYEQSGELCVCAECTQARAARG